LLLSLLMLCLRFGAWECREGEIKMGAGSQVAVAWHHTHLLATQQSDLVKTRLKDHDNDDDDRFDAAAHAVPEGRCTEDLHQRSAQW
jgi:hypothetical protein